MKLHFTIIAWLLIASMCVGCKSTLAEERSGKYESNLTFKSRFDFQNTISIGVKSLEGKLQTDNANIVDRISRGMRNKIWWDVRQLNGNPVSRRIISVLPGGHAQKDSLDVEVQTYRTLTGELVMPQSIGDAAAFILENDTSYWITFHVTFLHPTGVFDTSFSSAPYKITIKIPNKDRGHLPLWP